MIYRIYATKKDGFNVAAKKIKKDIRDLYSINLEDLVIIERYDIEGLDEQFLDIAINTIFSESPVDNVYQENLPKYVSDYKKIVVEYLPGQYDQRADSAMQCVEILTQQKRPVIRCAKVYCIKGANEKDIEKIKKHLINPVESVLGILEKPKTLIQENIIPEDVIVVEDFIEFDDEKIKEYYDNQSFAMTMEDLIFVREYFKKEKRNPTITELKVIDTYWSDHCRHTTFSTELINIEINSNNPHIYKAYDLYENLFNEINANKIGKNKCFMDIATIGMKKLRNSGQLKNLDISDEINACSVEVDVDDDGEIEKWLIMFKNETHNHPTEIEPFGGAATCLGGAIRDPLSGRTYVYQAMRITGAGDPNEKIDNTIKGKLPQRILTKTAAAGFSSYGNQIGLATGIVNEIYNNKYKAKRLETGYVIGGAPKKNIVRNKPKAKDIILLIGGDTGRDGCGGATGSSKAHNEESLKVCGAEVQKGNPLTERKLQRLFRNSEASKLIIKCNDFGAGGVSVAVGELADSLDIYLDKVPKKYAGLDSTELAISESQERMAVVIKEQNLEKMIELCREENLKAVPIAIVTSTGRMRMINNKKVVVDIKRDFLNTNGVQQKTKVKIIGKNNNLYKTNNKDILELVEKDTKKAILKDLSNLNVCSQKGLGEMFDSTIGASSIFMPFGGKYQLTPTLVMASKPPVKGETNTATVSSYACPINLLEKSTFVGAIYSIVMSINKLVASGVNINTIYLTLQEFFNKLGKNEKKWGDVCGALLGSLYAQINLGIAAIGGKDSMSGTFNELDVPPTIISFAMGIGKADTLISNVFQSGQKLFRIKLKRDENFVPDFKYLKKLYNIININIEKSNIKAATIVENDIMSSVIKSLIGERNGISFAKVDKEMFLPYYGDFIVAAEDISSLNIEDIEYIGIVDDSGITKGMDFEIDYKEIEKAFCNKLEKVFPTKAEANGQARAFDYVVNETYKCKAKIAKPNIFIPAFPGTNCEYDTAKRFNIAGGKSNIVVTKNLTPDDIKETISVYKMAINNAQIIAFPGGFSSGDEPDGSGKFIATTFRNPIIVDAVNDLLEKRDGLILGICNGFQALVKLGLLPYGKIIVQNEMSPTLTYNNIDRHISTIARIRVSSNLSPWLSSVKVGDVFNVPISHGEGRFVSSKQELNKIIKNGQIATQYVNLENKVTMESPYNPNGSMMAIEGINSIDGRIFGKMGHARREGKK